MRIMVVEDDFTSRIILQRILGKYGDCDVAINGREAIDAFNAANAENKKYDLICLDIMMPEIDGLTALNEIRKIEESKKITSENAVKIIMTTALNDSKNIMTAFKSQCEGYLIKPIDRTKLTTLLKKMNLIDDTVD